MNDKKARKKAAKQSAKDAKRQAKVMKRLAKLACPKCSHPASEHVARVSPGMSVFLMYDATITSPATGRWRCNGTVDQRGDDGFIRGSKCQCDLSPSDVEKNAKTGIKAPSVADIDLLLRPVVSKPT